jgi:hypothetical protein
LRIATTFERLKGPGVVQTFRHCAKHYITRGPLDRCARIPFFYLKGRHALLTCSYFLRGNDVLGAFYKLGRCEAALTGGPYVLGRKHVLIAFHVVGRLMVRIINLELLALRTRRHLCRSHGQVAIFHSFDLGGRGLREASPSARARSVARFYSTAQLFVREVNVKRQVVYVQLAYVGQPYADLMDLYCFLYFISRRWLVALPLGI